MKQIFLLYFILSYYTIPVMKANAGGSVVNVAPVHSAYVTSKRGLNYLTCNMALDYTSDNIRVNSVNPGTTATPMLDEAIVSGKTTSPQNRAATADEVSDVILFLASNEASNMTGAFVPVDTAF